MDDGKKLSETSLPEKEDSYGHLNVKVITIADYVHARSVCKDFERKRLGEYHICILKVIHYC